MKQFLQKQLHPKLEPFDWRNLILQSIGALVSIVVFSSFEHVVIILQESDCWHMLSSFILINIAVYIFVRVSKLFDEGIFISLVRVLSIATISFAISVIFVLFIQDDFFKHDTLQEFFKNTFFISIFGIFGALVLDYFA
ncbi:MAG: hypothetical protein HXX81_01805 [Campylobacterales bacterium]|nr:hypothetical protein [Campylobacterales bacterium]